MFAEAEMQKPGHRGSERDNGLRRSNSRRKKDSDKVSTHTTPTSDAVFNRLRQGVEAGVSLVRERSLIGEEGSATLCFAGLPSEQLKAMLSASDAGNKAENSPLALRERGGWD
jgi:hypothetical protein